MAVGAGSIARAVRAQAQEEAEKKRQAEAKAAGEKASVKSADKALKDEKKAENKQGDSIHEEKFTAVSHIQCDLPIYLL